MTYYRVVTITPDGDAASSEALVAPSNEPIIYGVSPTSGYQHEEYTFTATASGQEPLTYAWDFGGGATPNTSSDISPTVTLSNAGDYSCTLTISNSYAPTTFPFVLTVSARDTWAHTWGSNGSDRADDMAIDANGNVYITGWTSFGAGDVDILTLKYSPGGEVLWARAWGTSEIETGKGICISPEGTVIVGGNIIGSGRKEDIVILEYSQDGELIRSAVWGTEENESCVGMAQDEAGNLYITGRYYVTWGDASILLLKLDSDWNTVWAMKWGSEIRTERANTVDYEGGSLAIGGAVDTGDTNDALILKLDVDGNLQWARTWKLDMDEKYNSVMILPEGGIVAAGGSGNNVEEISKGILTAYDPEGNIVNGALWQSTSLWLELTNLSSTNDNQLIVTGNSYAGSFIGSLYLDSFSIIPGVLWTAPVAGMGFLSSAQDDAGNLYVVGYNYLPLTAGNKWPDDSYLSAITGVDGIGEGVLSDLSGTFTNPQGFVTMPEGIIDQESGTNEEAFIIKNPHL